MDIRNFNSFVVAAELMNITLAAKRLNLTQSALSRQIDGFEAYLGVKLFEKSGRNVRLTAKGEALLSKIKTVLMAEKSLRNFADDLAEGDAGILRVGACSQLIERYLPTFLKTWRKQNPGIEVRLEDGGGAELAEKLKNGLVQLTISALPTRPIETFETTRIGKLGFVAVATPEFLGTSCEPIEVAELMRLPTLLLNKKHASREVFDAACRLIGEVPSVVLESYSPHTLFALAEAGNGVAIAPSSARLASSPLTRRPIALRGELISFDICTNWSRLSPLPQYGQRFIDELSQHIRTEEAIAAAPVTRLPHLHVV